MTTPAADGKRVALLGGTFDPIHDGHLELARAVLEGAAFSQVLLVPAFRNPLKSEARATAKDRLAMVCLAVAELNEPRIGVLDWEVTAAGPSYTSVTLQRFTTERPDTTPTLVLGNEVFAALPRWHEPRTVLTLADILVISRDPAVPFRPVEVLTAAGLKYTSVSSTRATHSQGKRSIALKTFAAPPFSGTAIRAALAGGQRPEGLRHTVWAYVKENRLYAVS